MIFMRDSNIFKEEFIRKFLGKIISILVNCFYSVEVEKVIYMQITIVYFFMNFFFKS